MKVKWKNKPYEGHNELMFSSLCSTSRLVYAYVVFDFPKTKIEISGVPQSNMKT
jgi:hypothetical protein